ncbi:uncharacterized protein LOC128883367 [Hylaeus volcanicus]|uniref:uncharacterized protein LOC128883367 n=1 Tax=Hylaeus volcanicus TaxID=313075 RepID=UPI0023B7C7EB|nr:uncharacterized protein LOC128883367 [Hylaeus volcanicus]
MACAQVMKDNDLARFRTKLCQRYFSGSCEFNGRCQYSHSEMQQRRRCPFLLLNKEPLVVLRYIPVLCEDIKVECFRGVGCSFAHSEEEILFHPLIYKQKLCAKYHQCVTQKQCPSGTSQSNLTCSNGGCDLYYCPFVHELSEKRNISNYSYFLAPSFSKKLSIPIPLPLTSLHISKINTSRLSDVSLKETPWLRCLILMDSSNDTCIRDSSVFSSFNDSFNSGLPSSSMLSCSQDVESELESSGSLTIPLENVKEGSFYLAASYLTKNDILLRDKENKFRSLEQESVDPWTGYTPGKTTESAECPTLLHKVFMSNSCLHNKESSNKFSILWLTPGNIIQVLYVHKNFDTFSTTTPLKTNHDSSTPFSATLSVSVTDEKDSKVCQWAYGRCVSGTNKGKEGWFPLSLCFGIPQDKSSFVFELSKSASPDTLIMQKSENFKKQFNLLFNEWNEKEEDVTKKYNPMFHDVWSQWTGHNPKQDCDSKSHFENILAQELSVSKCSTTETSKILSECLVEHKNSEESKINTQHEVDFQSIQDELQHIHEHFRKILISELTVALSNVHFKEKADLSFCNFDTTKEGAVCTQKLEFDMCHQELIKGSVKKLLIVLEQLKILNSMRQGKLLDVATITHIAKTFESQDGKIETMVQEKIGKNSNPWTPFFDQKSNELFCEYPQNVNDKQSCLKKSENEKKLDVCFNKIEKVPVDFFSPWSTDCTNETGFFQQNKDNMSCFYDKLQCRSNPLEQKPMNGFIEKVQDNFNTVFKPYTMGTMPSMFSENDMNNFFNFLGKNETISHTALDLVSTTESTEAGNTKSFSLDIGKTRLFSDSNVVLHKSPLPLNIHLY